jgi:cell division septum initiation protein DivIVA
VLESRPTSIVSELAPEEVAARSFVTVRRGFEPDAVRRFLQEVAQQIGNARVRERELRGALAAAEAKAASPELDEATLTAALGQETTKVLRAAHDAARDVVARAEARAGELTAAADSILAERTAAAEHEAERLIGAARARSEALLDEARASCRGMVDEAREARRRILQDLAARRRELHLQLEQIRVAKDALIGIVETSADAVEGVRDRLRGAEAEARRAAEASDAPVIDDVPIEVLVAEALGERTGETAPVDLEVRRLDSAVEALGGGAGGLDHLPPAPEGTGLAASAIPEVSPPLAGATALDGLAGTPATGETLGDGTATDGAALGTAALEDAALGTDALEDAALGTDALEDGAPPLGTADDDDAGAAPLAADLALTAEIAAADLAPAMGDEPAAGGEAVAGDGLVTQDRLVSEEVVADPAPDAGIEPLAGELAAVGEGPSGGGEPAAADAERAAEQEGQAEADGHAMPDAAGALGGAPVHDDAPGEPSVPAETASAVDALFARIRASRAAEVAEARVVLEEQQSEPDVEVSDAAVDDPEAGFGTRRDDLVAAAVTDLERAVKRTLRSDQNEILAAARSLGAGDELAELLPGDEEASRLAEAARPALGAAFGSGALLVAEVTGAEPTGEDISPTTAGEIDGVADALADEVIGAIRLQLEATLGSAGGEDPARALGAAYREWKGERVAQLAGDYATQAFSLGVLEDAARRRLLVRWSVDERVQPCAECDDNALAGPQAPGEIFPTGQQGPPIHPGCRCVLLPVSP